jgi:hypothetical protein
MAELPDDVQAFLREHITSVMQLEVLLHLRRSAGIATPTEISRTVGGSVDAAIGCLHELEQGGLAVRVDDDRELCYRYEPADRRLRAAADAVADAYARRKVAVVTYIFSRPDDDPLRSFSDAFRFRRDR